MESTVGLLPLVHTLDSLYELVTGLPSPLPPDDGEPLVSKARVIGILVLQRVTDEQGMVLQRLLHPDFFDQTKDAHSFLARSSIAVLRGFLHGVIAEEHLAAQRQANAEAYAAAKLREERGFGFTGQG